MPALAIQQLTKTYGQRRGVVNVNLAVPSGSLFGFLGPNGAGKTTTIRVLLGLLRPQAGRAEIFGMDCWRQSPQVKRRLGYLPGDLRLYPWLNGRQALGLVTKARGETVLAPGLELAERFELDLHVKVRNMSRGTRQKLGLILAMAHRPPLLVLDEPSSSLDPIMQDRLRTYLRERASGGDTVFFSSHSLSEVEQLCDHVAIIREGRIVADQPLAALRRQAGHELSIRWRDGAEPELRDPPAGLRLMQRDSRTWRGVHDGPLDGLLKWLASQPIEDVTIGRPDLETLFYEFYRQAPPPLEPP